MPHHITREQALHRITSEMEPDECLACYIGQQPNRYLLHQGPYTMVVLSAYPRMWGQLMVILKTHKTHVSDLLKEEWDEIMENVRRAVVVLEKQLKPLRCYVASLGATENLPHTCPHIHFNVLPVYDPSDKPSAVFTWENGLYDGTKEEWENLYKALKQAWKIFAAGEEKVA